MNSPKFQFTTRALLLAVTFVAIGLGGMLGACAVMRVQPDDRLDLLIFVVGTAPFWMPISFAAYAIGRWTLSTWTLAAFATLEALAVFGTWFVDR
jgi:hypothetical protein